MNKLKKIRVVVSTSSKPRAQRAIYLSETAVFLWKELSIILSVGIPAIVPLKQFKTIWSYSQLKRAKHELVKTGIIESRVFTSFQGAQFIKQDHINLLLASPELK